MSEIMKIIHEKDMQKKKMFLETVQPNLQHVLFHKEPFLHKMLVWFFSSNISLYIGKNPVEKLCKVLEMELKIYTPVSLNSIFEKITFKVLHYIQHDFISQCPGLSKDQISMFKSLVNNYFILKYRDTL